MLKIIKQYAVTISILFAIIIINVVAYFNYSDNVKEQLAKQTDSHLQAVIDETVECLNIKLEERFKIYETLAEFVGNLGDVEPKVLEKALVKQSEAAGYDGFDIIAPNGTGLESRGSSDYGDNVSFSKALAGNSIMETHTDSFGNIDGIRFFIPIHKSGQVSNVLMVESTLEQFTEYMDISEVSQYGSVFIVKQDGTLLTRGYGLDEVENIEMILGDDKSSSKLLNNIQSRKSGYMSYNSGTSKRYICYARTEYNKWYMVSVVQASAIDTTNEDIANEGTVFFIEIGIIMSILFLYLVRIVIMENRDNKLNRERYHILSKYSDSIVFDYSREKDTMYCNEKWKETFGYDVERENLRENMDKYIDENDKERYTKIISELLEKEKEYVKFQVAIKDSQGAPVSCIMKIFAIKGKKRGKVQKILGVIEPCSKNI